MDLNRQAKHGHLTPLFADDFRLAPGMLPALRARCPATGNGRHTRFARELDRFTHGYTELKESALSYRGAAHGLLTACVVVAAEPGCQESTPNSLVLEIRPKVIDGGERVAYALRQLYQRNGYLIGSESPAGVITLEAGIPDTRTAANTFEFTVAESPRVQNLVMAGTVRQVMGVYTTDPQEFPSSF